MDPEQSDERENVVATHGAGSGPSATITDEPKTESVISLDSPAPESVRSGMQYQPAIHY